MPSYTICPEMVEFAGGNLGYFYDVLLPFLPDNSRKICFDNKGFLQEKYFQIAKTNKEILDWLNNLSYRPNISQEVISIDTNPINNNELVLDICKNTIDRKLISLSRNNFVKYTSEILKENINLYDKDLARVEINYGILDYLPDLTINNYKVTDDTLLKFVLEICSQFKTLIEDNGWFKLLYDATKKRVDENIAQQLFYGVAISYCEANDLKISPESNAGVGPIDFNISHGSTSVNVEMKFADNPKLKNGLKHQLDTYNKAERTKTSVYLVLYNELSEYRKIQQLNAILDYYEKNGKRKPIIYLIDYKWQVSGSNKKTP